MVSVRHAIPVIGAAALLACAEPPAGPRPPSAPSASLLPGVDEWLPGIPLLDPFVESLDGEGVVEWARGGGHIMFGEEVGLENARRTFAFTAKNLSDGTTQGQFQINNRAEDPTGVLEFFKEHGVVTCLEVDGKQAWVGGIVTHSDDPLFVTPFARVWRVIDNGEGSNEPRDEITLAQVSPPPPADQACHTRPPLPGAFLQEIEEGNIQVKDGAAPSP